MFAGHLLLALFATGGAFLLQSGNPVHMGVGVLAFVMGILVSFLELIVMFLQAYVFTLLAAMYIGEAIADEH
jgi:F-type H+-transporting ATPase subunit a